jgi:hypothetical protein
MQAGGCIDPKAIGLGAVSHHPGIVEHKFDDIARRWQMALRTPSSAPVLLERARRVLEDAAAAETAADRFCLAHLAALRTAAAVFAERARAVPSRRRIVNAWVLLERVAPEYASWAAYFAAGAAARAAVEAGAVSAVSQRAADDQVRAASEFLQLVDAAFGRLAA